MRVLVFIATVDIILSIISYNYLRVHFQFAKSWSFLLTFLFLMVNMVACRFLPPYIPLYIAKTSAWLSGLWIAVMYYLLILSVAHGVLHILDKLFHLNTPHVKIASAAMTFILLFVSWGTFRAFSPNLRTENIASEKLKQNSSYKIILLTDIHLGQVLGRTYSEKLVRRINEQQPDLVLISGDLLDEKIAYIEREKSLEPFKNINSKFGTFLAFGNHDYLDRPQLWQTILEDHNIQVLRNKSIIIDEQIKLTGINDWSRNRSNEEIIANSTDNEKYYSILLDHQPRRINAAAAAQYDLYLSGHTHTGQLFPNRQVTKRMYLLDYGRLNLNKTTAITSNGYGFWGPPVRTEVAPEFILINLQSKQ